MRRGKIKQGNGMSRARRKNFRGGPRIRSPVCREKIVIVVVIVVVVVVVVIVVVVVVVIVVVVF